jgi:hypothetical protein
MWTGFVNTCHLPGVIDAGEYLGDQAPFDRNYVEIRWLLAMRATY